MANDFRKSDVPIIGQSKVFVPRSEYPIASLELIKMISESEQGKKMLAEADADPLQRDIVLEICITCGGHPEPRREMMVGLQPVIRADRGQSCPNCTQLFQSMGSAFQHILRCARFQAIMERISNK